MLRRGEGIRRPDVPGPREAEPRGGDKPRGSASIGVGLSFPF